MPELKINGIELEICANSSASALAAQEAGASRVELCQNLENGGTTPSAGQILQTRADLHIGIHVLIRPRGGNFLYTESEVTEMITDIKFCKSAGVDGVVIGALTAEGQVDKEICSRLIDAAEGMHLTFHRAFDRSVDPFKAMDDLIKLGFHRILTSGLQHSAWEGRTLLKELQIKAQDKIVIMAGAGVHAENMAELIQQTAVRAVHSSAKDILPSAMRYNNSTITEMNEDTWYTSKEKVHQLVDILKNL